MYDLKKKSELKGKEEVSLHTSSHKPWAPTSPSLGGS